MLISPGSISPPFEGLRDILIGSCIFVVRPSPHCVCIDSQAQLHSNKIHAAVSPYCPTSHGAKLGGLHLREMGHGTVRIQHRKFHNSCSAEEAGVVYMVNVGFILLVIFGYLHILIKSSINVSWLAIMCHCCACPKTYICCNAFYKERATSLLNGHSSSLTISSIRHQLLTLENHCLHSSSSNTYHEGQTGS